MAFWSSEKLSQRLPTLIDQYDPERIKYSAYELSLGPEAFITSAKKKTLLRPKEPLFIPPGQFGLLLTEETVTIPKDGIGFISIKAGVKFRGLVNVSGFHVDPGFKGRLKFSVYNAGSKTIVLSRGDPVFILWFSDLDRPTEKLYCGDHDGQMEISSEDIMLIQGEVASPAVLKVQVDKLRTEMTVLRAIIIGMFVGLALLVTRVVFDWLKPAESSITSSPPAVIRETQRPGGVQTTAPPGTASPAPSERPPATPPPGRKP